MKKRRKYSFVRLLERVIVGMLVLNGLLAVFVDPGEHTMNEDMAQVTSNCETDCDDVDTEEADK